MPFVGVILAAHFTGGVVEGALHCGDILLIITGRWFSNVAFTKVRVRRWYNHGARAWVVQRVKTLRPYSG